MICRHVVISGRVQGVWYRGWTVQQARALNLTGWVRNLSDGRVEAVFQGPAESVRAMIDACRIGPAAARVDGIDEGEGQDPNVPDFSQRPTV